MNINYRCPFCRKVALGQIESKDTLPSPRICKCQHCKTWIEMVAVSELYWHFQVFRDDRADAERYATEQVQWVRMKNPKMSSKELTAYREGVIAGFLKARQ